MGAFDRPAPAPTGDFAAGLGARGRSDACVRTLALAAGPGARRRAAPPTTPPRRPSPVATQAGLRFHPVRRGSPGSFGPRRRARRRRAPRRPRQVSLWPVATPGGGVHPLGDGRRAGNGDRRAAAAPSRSPGPPPSGACPHPSWRRRSRSGCGRAPWACRSAPASWPAPGPRWPPRWRHRGTRPWSARGPGGSRRGAPGRRRSRRRLWHPSPPASASSQSAPLR